MLQVIMVVVAAVVGLFLVVLLFAPELVRFVMQVRGVEALDTLVRWRNMGTDAEGEATVDLYVDDQLLAFIGRFRGGRAPTGMTFGRDLVVVQEWIRGDAQWQDLLLHEMGHVLQARRRGRLYLPLYFLHMALDGFSYPRHRDELEAERFESEHVVVLVDG